MARCAQTETEKATVATATIRFDKFSKSLTCHQWTKPVNQGVAADIYLAPELVESVQDRLSRIEGHVRGVKRMIDEQADCDQILIQLSAIRSAVNQVTIKVLEGHMETCIQECVVAGQGLDPLERLKGALAQVLKNA